MMDVALHFSVKKYLNTLKKWRFTCYLFALPLTVMADTGNSNQSAPTAFVVQWLFGLAAAAALIKEVAPFFGYESKRENKDDLDRVMNKLDKLEDTVSQLAVQLGKLEVKVETL